MEKPIAKKALVTLVQHDGAAYYAILIVRDVTTGTLLAEYYDATTYNKDEFLTQLTKDIARHGCTSYETIDAQILGSAEYLFGDRN